MQTIYKKLIKIEEILLDAMKVIDNDSNNGFERWKLLDTAIVLVEIVKEQASLLEEDIEELEDSYYEIAKENTLASLRN